MQEALGIGADGSFGPGTERALKKWQASKGLTPDGIAGPNTLEKLLG
jgi:peptidoglycan hydrolase-like protein with peptidoglycan-binding domain